MKSAHYSCLVLIKLEFSRQIVEQSRIRFHQNPSSGRRVVSCGRTDVQTDLTKLRVAFRNFANAPRNSNYTIVPH